MGVWQFCGAVLRVRPGRRCAPSGARKPRSRQSAGHALSAAVAFLSRTTK